MNREQPPAQTPAPASRATTVEVHNSGSALFVSPRLLFESYQQNAVKADSDYKGRMVRVAGVVSEVRRSVVDKQIVVELDTGQFMRPVLCYVENDNATTVAAIRRGQLISVVGIVTGMGVNRVVLDKTRIDWTDPTTSTPKDEDALVLSRTAELCAMENWMRTIKARLLTEKDTKEQEKLADELREVRKKSASPSVLTFLEQDRKELEAKKLVQLPCSSPLVQIVGPCERHRSFEQTKKGYDAAVGPECDVPIVSAAIAKLRKH